MYGIFSGLALCFMLGNWDANDFKDDLQKGLMRLASADNPWP
jgi:hypothetical protein